MTIRVINKRTWVPDGTPVFYCGRPSPLGNPFVIGRDGSREAAVAKYRDWLLAQFGTGNRADRRFRYLLGEALAHPDIALSCFCARQDCHGRIIKAEIEYILHAPTQREEDEALFWKEAFS